MRRLVGSSLCSAVREWAVWERLEEELQKIYDSDIRVNIGWLRGGGIDVSIGHNEVTGNVHTVAEVLPWLQDAIAKYLPDSKYNVERKGGNFR